MDNRSDVLNGETNGFITPTDNGDQRITYFKHKRSFKRYEIAERRLFTSSPQSRGMITLRKVNLVKLFCDEFLLGEILKSCLTFKDLRDTVRIDHAEADSESSISLTPVNKTTDLQEHEDEAPKGHLLNQQSDCEVLVNMASLSISKQVPTFGLASKPDKLTEGRERELSGSFIQISTLRKENDDGALYDQHCDSVVSSRSVKPKRGVKSKKQIQKVVSSKKHMNQTLTISDMPQFISADSNCDTSAVPSDQINEKLSDRNNECTDPTEQLPINISVFKIPTVQSKRGKKQKHQEPDPKVNTKVQNSIESISMSSFNDSSFSPVQFTLPPESPQVISVMPTRVVQCPNSELCGQTPVSLTEITPLQNNSKVKGKRKIKDAKAGVAEEKTTGKSKGNCVMETGIRQKTRSAKKHSTQKYVEEGRKECAGATSQMEILDAVKSHKISSRSKAARKPEECEKMRNFSETTHDKVLECSAMSDVQKSQHVLEEDIKILNACSEKIKCFETNTSQALTDETHGKVSTRKRCCKILNEVHNDTMKENHVGNRKSRIARKLHKHETVEQSLVLMANSCAVPLPNEVLASNINQSDEKFESNVLLKSKRAFKDTRSRNSLTKATSSKPQQSNRASFPVLNVGDSRSNSTSKCPELGAQCVPSEDRKQPQIRSHFNPQSSFSDSKYRNRPKKAASADIQQKEIVLNTTENLKMNKFQEVCDVSVHDGQQGEAKLQVVENSSGVKMPQRQLRKRKTNMNLTENLNDETLQISVPASTQLKGVKQTKRTTTKVTTESIQKEHVQTLEKIKKPTARKSSCPEMAAGNAYTSKVKKEITKKKQSEVVTAPMPNESSKQDKVPASKRPTKLKYAARPKHSEDTRSDTKQASQKFVGAHCSAAGGVSNAVFEAVSMGARAFALFVRNGRTWKLNPLDVAEAEKFKTACKVHGFLPRHILPHGSYLLNCGSSNVDTLQKSRDTLVHELQICEMLGLEMYNFHPGSACGKGSVDECLMTVAESINLAHEKTNSVKTVIENMSCQGRTVGGKFEELKIIIDNVKDKSRIGVCLDTCHAFAAGFDLSSEEGFNKCIDSFDRIIGLHYLCAMHLNDSKGEVGCHLDRHENIGKGHIGIEGFRCVMNDPRLNNIPMILETPVNDYAKEIKILCDLENV